MTTMLDRAAMAVGEVVGYRGDDIITKDSLAMDIARAVLMAVRESDERHFSPVRAAGQWSLVPASAPVSDHVKAAADAQKCFTAMIDAILNEKPEGQSDV